MNPSFRRTITVQTVINKTKYYCVLVHQDTLGETSQTIQLLCNDRIAEILVYRYFGSTTYGSNASGEISEIMDYFLVIDSLSVSVKFSSEHL